MDFFVALLMTSFAPSPNEGKKEGRREEGKKERKKKVKESEKFESRLGIR